jgi:hypothetical protein
MSKVEIFDPAMCCSTGVCGPGVDPELLRMATITSNLEKMGKDIARHNLSEEPQAYVDNKAVSEVLMAEGADVLPLTILDGEVVKKGEYPTNDELLAWTGTDQEDLIMAMVKEKMAEQGKGCGCGCDSGSNKGGCCC